MYENQKKLHLRLLRKNWSLIAILGILWVTILILYILSVKMNQYHFVYNIDDAYIHMAMAKNFSQYGGWGVTKYAFSSSTSSILWVLLLSLIYKIFGVNDISPFILNIIFATASISLIYFIFKEYKFPQWYSFIVLLLIVFLTPIPALIFIGMEHNLQILLVITFIYISAKILTTEKIKNRYNLLQLFMGILLVSLRYELLILVGIIAILFFFKKKYYHSITLMALAVLPVLVYGIISTNHGWLFLPNSVLFGSKISLFLSKGILYSFKSILGTFRLNVENCLYLVFMNIICLFLFIRSYKNENDIWNFETLLLIIFISFTIITFAIGPIAGKNFSWYAFRYNAYLIVLGLFVLAINLKPCFTDINFKFNKNLLPKYLAIIFLVLLLLSPFSLRAISLVKIPLSTNNIYEQQYQMGLFLKEYYPGESVALNDLGAMSYLADIKILDFWGLGSLDTLEYKGDKSERLDLLVKEKNVKIILVYGGLFDSEKHDSWIKVAEWKTPNNMVNRNDTVVFYATSPEEAQNLIRNLKDFSNKLPSNIEQKIEYPN